MRHTFRYLVHQAPRPGDTIALSPEDSHHLVRVVRRAPDDPLELIDPAGRLWAATLVAPGPPATVRVWAARAAPAPAPLTLYLGLLEAGRLDLVVEKAAELGVERVVLVQTERVRRTPDAEALARRLARLGRVVAAAARQSGRATLTRVEGLVPFAAVLDQLSSDEAYLIDARAEAGLDQALRAREPTAGGRAALVVGPEAGFTEVERAGARERGIPACRLGPATLRAETAALVAMSLALAATGHLDGGGDGLGAEGTP